MYEKLDEKYWKKQDYLLYLNDVLANMVKQNNQKTLTQFKIEMNEKQSKEFEKLNDDSNLFEWLDNNGFHEKALHGFECHVFFSLLQDFCFYIYESLSCAERGKITVAYSLLRKPIRDNLFYLEWLLADKDDFYQCFMYNDIKKCDITSKNFTLERKKSIISSAISKTFFYSTQDNNSLIYDLRFNSESDISLQKIWNKTTHIVTTNQKYKTERSNFNFIFADLEMWNDYIDYYYKVVPELLTYALSVCESLFLKTIDLNDFQLLFNRAIWINKFMVNCNPKIQTDADKTEFIKHINSEGNIVVIKCSICQKNIEVTPKLFNEIINDFFILCPHCNEEQSICRYFIDVKLKEKNI